MFEDNSGYLSGIKYLSRDLFSTEETPSLNIYRKDNQYKVLANLPGLETDDINISYDDGFLVVSGHKKNADKGQTDFIRTERSFGRFSRIIKFTKSIDADSIYAKFANGMLEINCDIIDDKKKINVK